jgi:hypothetical protein
LVALLEFLQQRLDFGSLFTLANQIWKIDEVFTKPSVVCLERDLGNLVFELVKITLFQEVFKVEQLLGTLEE